MTDPDSVPASPPVSLLIGQGAIAVNCADALLKSGHVVRMVCTGDPALAEWARVHGITFGDDLPAFEKSALGDGCDFLFSIVNFRLLSARLLNAPRILAINYHDGPLPRYGGSNAPSWAILNGETLHGITWHVMAERVDQGDILKQAAIPVTETDTGRTLNTKCHFAAVRSFRALLGELASRTWTRTPQDPAQRTFYLRSRTPTPDCVIPLEWPARQIDAFCRALDLGAESSPMGIPKIVVDGKAWQVRSVECSETPSVLPPGSLIEAGDGFLKVATGSVDVVFRGAQRLSAGSL